jgi:hypothetical protein
MDASGILIASIFRVEKAKQQTAKEQVEGRICFLLCLFFDPEDGSDTVHLNVGGLVLNYASLQSITMSCIHKYHFQI